MKEILDGQWVSMGITIRVNGVGVNPFSLFVVQTGSVPFDGFHSQDVVNVDPFVGALFSTG